MLAQSGRSAGRDHRAPQSTRMVGFSLCERAYQLISNRRPKRRNCASGSSVRMRPLPVHAMAENDVVSTF